MAFIYFSMRSKMPNYHGKINKKMCPFTGVSGFIFPWWKCWKNKMPLKIRLIKIRKRPYMDVPSFNFFAYAQNLKSRARASGELLRCASGSTPAGIAGALRSAPAELHSPTPPLRGSGALTAQFCSAKQLALQISDFPGAPAWRFRA